MTFGPLFLISRRATRNLRGRVGAAYSRACHESTGNLIDTIPMPDTVPTDAELPHASLPFVEDATEPAEEARSAEDGHEPEDGHNADDRHDDESEPDEPRNGFADLGLSEPILKAVAEMGYLIPTPVQAQAIPFVLMNRDVLGCAQTGTGKTAGFTLPMLDILSGSRARARMPRSLILEPTRELALQVAENFVKYGKYLQLKHALIIGGESISDRRIC